MAQQKQSDKHNIWLQEKTVELLENKSRMDTHARPQVPFTSHTKKTPLAQTGRMRSARFEHSMSSLKALILSTHPLLPAPQRSSLVLPQATPPIDPSSLSHPYHTLNHQHCLPVLTTCTNAVMKTQKADKKPPLLLSDLNPPDPFLRALHVSDRTHPKLILSPILTTGAHQAVS